MNDNQLHRLLSDAKFTIEQQRREIDALTPKAEAYDRIGQILALGDQRGGYGIAGVDPVWDLTRALEEIQMRQETQKMNEGTKPSPDEIYVGKEGATPAEFIETLSKFGGQTGQEYANTVRGQETTASADIARETDTLRDKDIPNIG